jgi:DNA repair protein RadC
MKVREVVVQYKHPVSAEEVIREPSQAAALMRRLLPDNSREHVISIYLNGAHRPVGYAVLTTGTETQAPLCPRELFQRALLAGAAALIVGHNHPSGDVVPSAEDRAVTAKLVAAGKMIGLPVLDHIVFGDNAERSAL